MAGGVISTGSFPKGLWEGVKSWWDSAAEQAPAYWDQMYRRETSTKNFEEYVQAIGTGIAPRKPEGQGIQYDSMNQGFIARGTNAAYALGIITTHEEMKDNLYVKLTKNRIEKLRRAFQETKNINATNIYNRSSNSGYVGADGVSLLNTAHPNFSGGTWQNTLSIASQFSQAAVEDMLILMMQAKDDRGFIEPLACDSLIVHPNNKFNAARVMKTAKSVGNNNNDINPIMTMGEIKRVVVNPYLTGTGPWFLTTNCIDGMIWQEREKLEFWEDNDFDTRNYKVAAYERYTFLWANPRGVYGSNAP